jgi:hypothetical protein
MAKSATRALPPASMRMLEEVRCRWESLEPDAPWR